jgi:ABC-type uncharacterized transport system permease subunit
LNSTLFTILTAGLYLICGVAFGLRLFGRLPPENWLKKQRRSTLLLVVLVAASLHVYLLFDSIVGTANGGLNFGFFNAISLVTWLIAMLVVAAAFSRPVESLCVVILPSAAVAVVLDALFSSSHVLLPAEAAELRYHIVISILAYSTLSTAALQSVLLSIQNRYLRSKHPGGFIRAFPPLETMESLLFQMLGIGFVLLSLSLMTGLPQIEDMFAQHQVHKTILSIVAWTFFAVLLWGRRQYGWRGRTAVRWVLSGFIVLLLAYFGVKLVKELLLGR